MKIKYILAVVAVSATTQVAFAQYNQDALRFSRFDRGGTARMKGIGNASTAIGGDLGAISANPAGLGFFNASEFSFTPELNGSDISSTYFNQNESASKNQFNFNNASIVFHTSQRVARGADPTRGLLSVNFGLSWNRTNNFYDNVFYAGKNVNNSIADMLADQAYNTGATIKELKAAGNPLGRWGYEHFLVDSVGMDATGNIYQSVTKLNSSQALTQGTTGGQNEFNLALGTNYGNKLYLGLSLGFTSLKYNSTSEFAETGQDTRFNQGYRTFFDNNQATTGSGFNLKAGLIYKPTQSVQLGASFSSPTWYSIEDRTTLGLETFYQNNENYKDSKPFDRNYNLRTPLKVSGGLAVFAGNKGFISADVEYVDYSTMHLSGYEEAEDDNARIKQLYQSAVNARIGGEAKLSDNVYARAGYGYLGNPEKGIGSATTTISGGLGYRINNFFMDATYTNVSRDQKVYGYELYDGGSPEASLKRKYNNVYLTIGFRF